MQVVERKLSFFVLHKSSRTWEKRWIKKLSFKGKRVLVFYFPFLTVCFTTFNLGVIFLESLAISFSDTQSICGI